jgi:class 3 adenylate cyclase/tetratricopeptide (TPR) repeat protein
MNCPACDQPNRDDAGFCDSCGQDLRAGRVDPREYTPAHLAKKILQDRAKLQGERRTVTVLYADAVGSTAMAEHLDPEETFRIMQGAVACMADAVHQCEGIITQFRGDGVMALFGAPIAHENAAHRAVAAALAMQRRIEEYAEGVEREHGAVLRFRVGLNTGLVVVGAISDNLSMDYTAMGDTVNLAARMEQVAQPGTVYLSDSTYRAVRDYVECEQMGPFEVKGKSQPVLAYRAIREMPNRSRLEVAASRGLTPFVGRDEELAKLGRSIEQVKQGKGQVVFLSGEAGIGKSRLLLEFRRSLGDDVAWLEGRCLSYGACEPYLPLIDIVRGVHGITAGDDEATIQARIASSTADWSDRSRATLPYLRYLLNVSPGDPSVAAVAPEERGVHIRDALRAVLFEESHRRPLVVVIEDLHWIDESSNATLFGLFGTVAFTPVLMLLTHRPGGPRFVGARASVLEAEALVPARSLGNPEFYRHVDLNQLSTEVSGALAGGVMGAALPQEIRELIIGKAEGNPFFVEEISRSFLESGVVERSNGGYALRKSPDEVRIPDTVEEVLLARIDRLPQEPRQTVQLASVIGREFGVRLLERIADPQSRLDAALAELKDLEFIFETAYVPEFSYAFKHTLTGEVAYATLLHERRRTLHRAVAASMEELYANRLAEHYEMLAHHYFEGEVWERALDYLEKAGDKAFAVYANQRAADSYAKALAICERLGDTGIRKVAGLSQKRFYANFMLRHHVEALEDADRWRAAAARLGDPAWEGQALVNRGYTEHFHQSFEGGVAALEAALALANAKDLDAVRLPANSFLIASYYDCHRMDDARRVLQTAVEIAERMQSSLPTVAGSAAGTVVNARVNLGTIGGFFLTWTGRFDDALAHLERYGESSAAHPNLFMRFMFQFSQALALGGRGKYVQALALLHEVITTCEHFGEYFYQGRMMNTLGWIYGDLQDFDRSIEWNERSLSSARGNYPPGPEVEGNALVNLADDFIALGRLDEAEDRLGEVARMVEEKVPKDCMQQWRYELHHYASFAELWLARGDWEAALSAADECLALADKTESQKYVVTARRSRGQALLAQGRFAEAEADILAALPLAVEVGNPPQLWRTHAALGELRRAQSRPDDARHAYGNALAVIESVAAGLTDAELRDTFLRSEHVQGIKTAAEAA